MQLDALPLIDALFCEVNPIPVKAALNMMGKEVGTLRAPLTEMEDAHERSSEKSNDRSWNSVREFFQPIKNDSTS